MTNRKKMIMSLLVAWKKDSQDKMKSKYSKYLNNKMRWFPIVTLA